MEAEVHHALLEHGGIQGSFPVFQHFGILVSHQVLGFPVTRNGAGEFPAELVYHIGVRVILNGAGVGLDLLQILTEPFLAVWVHD